MLALSIIIAIFCVAWLGQAALVARNLGRIRDLMSLHAPDPALWPRVSTIVPARNEAADLSASLTSRLSDGYPNLEVIVVDDRSSDETPRILAGFSAKDSRVRTVRIDELPDGWLGKLHALDRGVREASGEWLLFSDADIVLAPGALSRAIAHCEEHGFDVLALIPEFRSKSGLVNVLWAIFIRVFALAVNPDDVRNPASPVAVGSGAFTLVRRAAFERTPGFEHLRLETADDMALGAMLKASGARCEYANGRDAATVSLYDDVPAFFLGVEKNGSSLMHVPFPALVGIFALLGCVEYSPLVALAVGALGHVTWLAWLGAFTALVATAATVAPFHRNTGHWLAALGWPIGWPLMAGALLRSVWLVHRRGGVVWRGTHYPTAQVLSARRFHIG
ncbi:MAG: glycosyltransferase family 2 protein [Actinomycetota bacterium]|nr:glycosyltransferase family 2 protein [Actinomycetota bacterium]